MKPKLPSEVCSEVIAEWQKRRDKYVNWNPENHEEEIVKAEQLLIIEDMEELLTKVFECIDNFNKASLMQHHKLLAEYGDTLPAEIKKRYVDTIMKWTVI